MKQLPAPEQFEGSLFWNFKVPVYAKLVEPPHAKPEWQAAALTAIFAAAEAVNRDAHKPSGVRVACLVTTPLMWSSEVTLFADEDYFRTFLPPAKASRSDWEGGWVAARAADADETPAWFPAAPNGLCFYGGVVLTEGEHALPGEVESAGQSRIQWVWAFDRESAAP